MAISLNRLGGYASTRGDHANAPKNATELADSIPATAYNKEEMEINKLAKRHFVRVINTLSKKTAQRCCLDKQE
jgi:hypothetical protein